MLLTLLNENIKSEKMTLVSSIDLETEEEDNKVDNKKEKEEYKYITKCSLGFDRSELLGNLYISLLEMHTNPSISTSTPPPDYI
jgi:hypothetical protein